MAPEAEPVRLGAGRIREDPQPVELVIRHDRGRSSIGAAGDPASREAEPVRLGAGRIKEDPQPV